MSRNAVSVQTVTERPYDPDAFVESQSSLGRLIFNPPRWVLRILRAWFPILRLFGWAAVLRYDDVVEVLTRHDVFVVPFAAEMARLNDGSAPGTPFILGMDDRKAHDRQLSLVMRAFKRGDVGGQVTQLSYQCARTIIREAIDKKETGDFDAISKLITAVPLEICRNYYGIEIPDPRTFAYASIEVSGHLFGPPPIVPVSSIDRAADYVRRVVNHAIAGNPKNDTVLHRLMDMHRSNPSELTIEDIRAFLMGMIVGFVPTNTMAGGHILEVLLNEKDYLKKARDAALNGDDDLLQHCLFEAMRFMPLNPGPFRICSSDYTVAAGTSRAKTIRSGDKVLASTLSAMFDSRVVERPQGFDPSRSASDYMLFGFGIHWCAGIFIARAQITQTFKALLLQPGLRRAGRGGALILRGLFPDHLVVEFDVENEK